MSQYIGDICKGFTTPGNGEVKDDITDDSTKEFLTVTTKNNNTYGSVLWKIPQSLMECSI